MVNIDSAERHLTCMSLTLKSPNQAELLVAWSTSSYCCIVRIIFPAQIWRQRVGTRATSRYNSFQDLQVAGQYEDYLWTPLFQPNYPWSPFENTRPSAVNLCGLATCSPSSLPYPDCFSISSLSLCPLISIHGHYSLYHTAAGQLATWLRCIWHMLRVTCFKPG